MKRLAAWQWVAVAILVVTGCTPQGITIGPVPVSLPIEGGSLDPAQLVMLPIIDLEYTTRMDFCSLPTEAELVAQMPQMGSIDVGSIVSLTSINVGEIVLTATTGDFSWLREMTISFVPKPVNGQEQEPVVIGYASSPGGFGSTVTLVPPTDVDLLDLIRDNDANPLDECPQVEITIKGSRPSSLVEWDAQLDAEIFAKLGGSR